MHLGHHSRYQHQVFHHLLLLHQNYRALDLHRPCWLDYQELLFCDWLQRCYVVSHQGKLANAEYRMQYLEVQVPQYHQYHRH